MCFSGSILDKNNFVIFESTVYPGLTEEICIPIISKKSKLKFNKDFFCGYSPERINPNDKKHKLQNIVKITSGSNTYSANIVDKLYLKIIKAGTFKASNIKIAEAAKVIENTQKVLILHLLMNQYNINNLKIDTNEILKAANSKWNFLNFKPGLVGGHCIGVDPYYLTYKSKQKGYYPKIITAGRNINDNFPNYIFKKTLYETKKIFKTEKLRFLILGLTFKEDCVDYRNSKSIELVKLFKSQNHETHCFDPLIDIINFNKEYKFKINKKLRVNYYHCVIISVAHKIFIKQGEKKIRRYLINDGLIFDVKNIYPKNQKNIYL